jgi:hypothetical protein
VPRRASSRPSLGTIVPNPGGPGVTAIANGGAYVRQFAPILDRRDLLLIPVPQRKEKR